MNYDKADLSDPLLKINIKNFGSPKPGFRPTEHPGIKIRRYDKIVPVKTAKKRKTFKEFNIQSRESLTEQWTPKGTFNKMPSKESGLLDKIKSQEDIDNEKREFIRVTGIPLAKKKTKTKTV